MIRLPQINLYIWIYYPSSKIVDSSAYHCVIYALITDPYLFQSLVRLLYKEELVYQRYHIIDLSVEI